MQRIVIILAALGLAACSNNSGGTITSAINSGLSTARTKLTAIVPDTSSVALFMPRSAMTTEWGTTGAQYSIGGDFGDSPRLYVLKHGDKTSQGSLMFRLNQAMENVCIFATALPSTGGVIDLSTGGTTTLSATVKAQMVTDCGATLSQLPADGTVVGYKVTDVSGETGSHYSRRASYDLQGGTNYSEFFHYTITDTVTRFSYKEGNDSYVAFDYDSTTGIAKFEYSGFENSGALVLHYRGILVEGSDLGRFVANVHRLADGDEATALVSTLEGGGDTLAATYTFVDGNGGDDFADGNACISTASFNVSVDNTLSCSGGAITGAAAADYTFDIAGITTGYITGRDETSSIQFTGLADILTANSAQ